MCESDGEKERIVGYIWHNSSIAFLLTFFFLFIYIRHVFYESDNVHFSFFAWTAISDSVF